MNSFTTLMLVAHVIFGLFGVAAIHFAYMQLIRSHPPYRLVTWSAWSSVFLFFTSWITGAYYYVVYYGASVKPVILAGDYPWAHQFFMEAKEHVFILIPFLAIVSALGAHALGHHETSELKRAVSWTMLLTILLGIGVAASGILISGAVR